MAFKHGKNTKVAIGGLNATSYLNEASQSSTSETAATTTFGKGAATYVLGVKDGTVSLSGLFDGDAGAIDETMQAALGTEDAGMFLCLPVGDSGVGSRVWFGKGEVTSYEVSSPVGDVVSLSAEIQADGGVNSGVYLRGQGSGTNFLVESAAATTTSAAHDSSASSANGGVGQLHVMSNTRDGTVAAKIQHSVDNVTWVDLITFTTVAAGAEDSEQIEVTGTVNRYLRSVVTTGGTTGSAQVAVAFKRN